MPGSRLADIQARFYALVTAPEGVAQGLATAGLAAADLEAIVKGDGRLGAVARLDVYANMYFYRLLDVLRDAYPRLCAAVGDPTFHNLVTDYLVACPPAHPSIAFAGERLPSFLAGHPLAAERPWLVPLAVVDRTYVELFDGPDAEPLTLDQLRALPPAELATSSLRLVPCHRVLEHGFLLDPLWRAPGQGEAGAGFPGGPGGGGGGRGGGGAGGGGGGGGAEGGGGGRPRRSAGRARDVARLAPRRRRRPPGHRGRRAGPPGAGGLGHHGAGAVRAT